MSEESLLSLRAVKIANIIASISELYHVSLEDATETYYSSQLAGLIEEGVADLHCRSDKYLASVIWDESHDK